MRCIFTLSKIWKKNIFFVFACFLCDSRVEMTSKSSENFLKTNCCTIGWLAQTWIGAKPRHFGEKVPIHGFWRNLRVLTTVDRPCGRYRSFLMLFMCLNSVSNLCVMCVNSALNSSSSVYHSTQHTPHIHTLHVSAYTTTQQFKIQSLLIIITHHQQQSIMSTFHSSHHSHFTLVNFNLVITIGMKDSCYWSQNPNNSNDCSARHLHDIDQNKHYPLLHCYIQYNSWNHLCKIPNKSTTT